MSKAAKKSSPKIAESELRNWKLLEAFQRRLQPALERAPPTATGLDARRTLFTSEYFSILLFGLYNPVLKSTRALCSASGLKRMGEEVCGGIVGPGSFSEMQHLVDPDQAYFGVRLRGSRARVGAEAGSWRRCRCRSP